MHKLVARIALAVHMVFVAFTVFGGFLAWMAPWVLIPHLGTAAWGARMAALRAKCPLSTLENWGRRGAGDEQLQEGGFITHYFEDRVYPKRWARKVEIIAGTVIIGSWIGLTVR